jgi:hypothetical protein
MHQADWYGDNIPFSYSFTSRIVRAAVYLNRPLVPNTVLQNPMFVCERFLKWDLCVMGGNALNGWHRGVEAQ